MPFLRFTRDKRGYETTSLVHAFRGRHGRARQKVLYWFRTPPNVKVGRPALDEEAIRWIEEHNRDVEFDWPKILEATAPPAPLTEEQRGRRTRRVQVERRTAARQRPPERPPQMAPAADFEEPELAPVSRVAEEIEEDTDAPEEQALAQLARPEADETPTLSQSAVESAMGHEQLVRLRARYAELQARITERGGDAAETLRAQAEALNPDAWVTFADVKTGLGEFEQRIRDLRAALGLKRRRRSRRGGRHRRGSHEGGAGQAGQTPAADSASNAPDETPGDAGEDNAE